VPNDYLRTIGLMLKGTYQINKNLSGMMSANITNNTYRSAGSISSVYTWPINDDITNYEDKGWPRFRYLDQTKKKILQSVLCGADIWILE